MYWPKYADLFTSDERAKARYRLEASGDLAISTTAHLMSTAWFRDFPPAIDFLSGMPRGPKISEAFNWPG